MKSTVMNGEYRNVPIATLTESPTNPRKRFDEKALENSQPRSRRKACWSRSWFENWKNETIKSLLEHGASCGQDRRIGRRSGSGCKVDRRRGHRSPGSRELATRGHSPTRRSLGFPVTLGTQGRHVHRCHIAARAGKSEAYVYSRVKLTDLTPPVAEAFLNDKITTGHALLIAKLPAAQQQEAFAASFRSMWTSEGNTQVLIPVRELAAWIESNILLELDAAPFDKQDETLVTGAGSCANCPKRTGFNKLLFSDVRKDSCTDPQCFRAKIDAHVSKALETKPTLVQISSAWNSREGAPLGRNRYVELQIKKARTNDERAKLSAFQNPCESMTEAIVTDGGKRGHIVKVCPDPACRVHRPDAPSPEQVERERATERKRIQKEKLAITTRHRILATILQRVSAPLKKADLQTVAQYLVAHLSYNQVPALAKRHKVEVKKDSDSVQELLVKQVSTYDEAEVCKLLLEISLLDSAYQRSTANGDDVLMSAAKRYRVDTEKLQKAVAGELAAKLAKKGGSSVKRVK